MGYVQSKLGDEGKMKILQSHISKTWAFLLLAAVRHIMKHDIAMFKSFQL